MRPLHAKILRSFVSANKADATDAHAIWLAVQQPSASPLTLQRQRELLMIMFTMQPNALREQVLRTKTMSADMQAIEKRLGLQLKSGREFCAWLGPVLKQSRTDGKVRLHGIYTRATTTCAPCWSVRSLAA